MKQLTLVPVSTPEAFTPKEIAAFFFKHGGESTIRDPKTKRIRTMVTYNCMGCVPSTVVTIKKNTGYQNLAQHVYTFHKDHLSQMRQAHGPGKVTSIGHAVSDKALNVFGCLDWIVHSNLPFSFFESARTKQYSDLDGIGATTVRKYLQLVTQQVESEVSSILPTKSGLMFDGWSSRNEHFLAVFAVFAAGGKLTTPLLSMAPLIDSELSCDDSREVSHGAREHQLFLGTILANYGRDLESVSFMVCDNCGVNRRVSKNLGVPMISCASHRLNLAVKKYMETFYADEVECVRRVMVALKTLNNGVRLKKAGTYLSPITYNATRWSSMHDMIALYLELKPFISTFSDRSFLDILPTVQQDHSINELVSHLRLFECVSKHLQKDDVGMPNVRTLFDGLIDLYPTMASHIGRDASIVESPSFENAIVKLQNGEPLDIIDLSALARFEVDAGLDLEETGDTDYVTQLLKKAQSLKSKKYDDTLLFVPPTSNCVERFFSQAKLVLNPLRQVCCQSIWKLSSSSK
ncbi:hypothetical protein LEN26_013546 [Aphanomyces euteiches]|nr:hypothetical protein LEN26_013546 [Aphanomyces euteiches]